MKTIIATALVATTLVLATSGAFAQRQRTCTTTCSGFGNQRTCTTTCY
jgi:hypothetical protein